MRGWQAALAALLAGCSHRAPPDAAPAHLRYVVGAPYQLGGVWSYPREQFHYESTGLAERVPRRPGRAADGERLDADGMTGAHRTLQLPAIADVTNLENGRQIRIRINDRGPSTPGRVLGLSAHAADLLGAPPGGPIPVRIELDSLASQALRDRLGGGPTGITAAPVASVTQEALPAPGHAGAAVPIARVAPTPAPDPAPATLDTLPDTVRTVPVTAVRFWIRTAEFTQPGYAESLSRRLSSVSARVERRSSGGRPGYAVLAGPFGSAAQADAALDQVRAAGVTDASIVAE